MYEVTIIESGMEMGAFDMPLPSEGDNLDELRIVEIVEIDHAAETATVKAKR